MQSAILYKNNKLNLTRFVLNIKHEIYAQFVLEYTEATC